MGGPAGPELVSPALEGGGVRERESGAVYVVVKCGASGHNVRSQASLRAPPVGMLVQGSYLTTDCQVNNSEGEFGE